MHRKWCLYIVNFIAGLTYVFYRGEKYRFVIEGAYYKFFYSSSHNTIAFIYSCLNSFNFRLYATVINVPVRDQPLRDKISPDLLFPVQSSYVYNFHHLFLELP